MPTRYRPKKGRDREKRPRRVSKLERRPKKGSSKEDIPPGRLTHHTLVVGGLIIIDPAREQVVGLRRINSFLILGQ